MKRRKLIKGIALIVLSTAAVWIFVAAVGYGNHAWGRVGIDRESPRKRQSVEAGFNKKKEVCRATIKMSVTFYGDNINVDHKIFVNGHKKFHDTLRFKPANNFFWNLGRLQKIHKTFRIDHAEEILTIRHEISPRYSPIRNNKASRLGDTKYDLKITGCCWPNEKAIKEAPTLARNSFKIHARPWVHNPSDPDFRVQTVSIPLHSKK